MNAGVVNRKGILQPLSDAVARDGNEALFPLCSSCLCGESPSMTVTVPDSTTETQSTQRRGRFNAERFPNRHTAVRKPHTLRTLTRPFLNCSGSMNPERRLHASRPRIRVNLSRLRCGHPTELLGHERSRQRGASGLRCFSTALRGTHRPPCSKSGGTAALQTLRDFSADSTEATPLRPIPPTTDCCGHGTWPTSRRVCARGTSRSPLRESARASALLSMSRFMERLTEISRQKENSVEAGANRAQSIDKHHGFR